MDRHIVSIAHIESMDSPCQSDPEKRVDLAHPRPVGETLGACSLYEGSDKVPPLGR